jgi:hypothetical protein
MAKEEKQICSWCGKELQQNGETLSCSFCGWWDALPTKQEEGRSKSTEVASST